MIYLIIVLLIIIGIETYIIFKSISAYNQLLIKVELLTKLIETLFSTDVEELCKGFGCVRGN